MPTKQRGLRGNTLSRYTSLELAVSTSPTVVSLAVGTMVVSWPFTLLGWLSFGLFGLLVAVGSSRTSTVGHSLVDWPRPETKSDVAVNGIAYNGVLVLGVTLAQVIWSVSNSILLAVITGTILPVWFLKHIYILAFLDET